MQDIPSSENVNILSPDMTMVLLTWVTFLALLTILYKFAWKPILAALETREQSIRKALDDADKVQAELASISGSRAQVLNEAQQKANAILDEARKTSKALANAIEEKAREESKALVDAARKEIEGEKDRVIEVLRQESVAIAVNLAEKILQENIDPEKNRKLIDQFLKEM